MSRHQAALDIGMWQQYSTKTRTSIQQVVYPFLARHFEVVVAAKAHVVVLLEVLDVQDDPTLVATRPQPLAAVYGLSTGLVPACR